MKCHITLYVKQWIHIPSRRKVIHNIYCFKNNSLNAEIYEFKRGKNIWKYVAELIIQPNYPRNCIYYSSTHRYQWFRTTDKLYGIEYANTTGDIQSNANGVGHYYLLGNGNSLHSMAALRYYNKPYEFIKNNLKHKFEKDSEMEKKIEKIKNEYIENLLK